MDRVVAVVARKAMGTASLILSRRFTLVNPALLDNTKLPSRPTLVLGAERHHMRPRRARLRVRFAELDLILKLTDPHPPMTANSAILESTLPHRVLQSAKRVLQGRSAA